MRVSSLKFCGNPSGRIRTDTREYSVERANIHEENNGRFSRLDALAPENPCRLGKPCRRDDGVEMDRASI